MRSKPSCGNTAATWFSPEISNVSEETDLGNGTPAWSLLVLSSFLPANTRLSMRTEEPEIRSQRLFNIHSIDAAHWSQLEHDIASLKDVFKPRDFQKRLSEPHQTELSYISSESKRLGPFALHLPGMAAVNAPNSRRGLVSWTRDAAALQGRYKDVCLCPRRTHGLHG